MIQGSGQPSQWPKIERRQSSPQHYCSQQAQCERRMPKRRGLQRCIRDRPRGAASENSFGDNWGAIHGARVKSRQPFAQISSAKASGFISSASAARLSKAVVSQAGRLWNIRPGRRRRSPSWRGVRGDVIGGSNRSCTPLGCSGHRLVGVEPRGRIERMQVTLRGKIVLSGPHSCRGTVWPRRQGRHGTTPSRQGSS